MMILKVSISLVILLIIFIVEVMVIKRNFSPPSGVDAFSRALSPVDFYRFTIICERYSDKSMLALASSLILPFAVEVVKDTLIDKDITKVMERWLFAKVNRSIAKAIRKDNDYRIHVYMNFIYGIVNGSISFASLDEDSEEHYFNALKELYNVCPYDIRGYWEHLYELYYKNKHLEGR